MLARAFPTPLVALLVAALVGYLAGRHSGSGAPAVVIHRPKDIASNPRQTVFDELTAAETRAVAAYVVAAMPGVKTSMFPDGGADGDYISGTSAVELIPPEKAAAVAYVDMKSDARPPRFAKVTVVRGSMIDVMEYKVGPLKGCDENDCDAAYVTPGSPIVPLVADGAIPFEKRPMDMSDATVFEVLIPQVLTPLTSLLLQSFGSVWDESLIPGCGAACFSGEAGALFPFAFNDIESNDTTRVSKLQFFWHLDSTNFQAIWLHPLPFSVRIAQRGVHPADWYAYDLYYCGVGPFASAQALLAANVSRCTYQPDATTEGRRGAWDVPGPDQLHQIRPSLLAPEPPAPAYYSLAGASGGNGRLVTWQGWSFFVTLRPSTGLAAMDVRFKGVRVAYELALSEAAALYSGTGADQVFYLDSAYSMSQLGGDLAPGIDCPTHASYLDGVLWFEQHERGDPIDMDSDVARARPYKAFCVFEQQSSSSHWRHLQYATKSVDGVPSSTLVVRAVTAVGNYDYMTELHFHLDGSVRVAFEFAGYMETRWFAQAVTPWERSLGEVVHPHLAAPLHSHFGCFKVDLEGVSGGGESLEKVTVTAGSPPEVPELRGHATKYVQREYVQVEGVGISTTSPSGGPTTTWAIVDKGVDKGGGSNGAGATADDATPSSPPGYMIVPGPTVRQALPDEHPFVRATAFSKYTLAVLRRHEAEQRATSVYDLFGPAQPYTSLDSFVDGEGLEQQDLVAWVTVGKEHVPRTEDLPLISNFGTYFDILPRNVHRANAAMDVYTLSA